MGDGLYLHEVVDIAGRGGPAYMDRVLGFDAAAAADAALALAGTWEVVGSTGRWPQVVNLWAVRDGWDGWGRLARRTNLGRAANPELTAWWDEAHQHRTGGFDRLLGLVPGSPDPVGAAAAGTAGELAVHEVTRVRPGSGPAYLEALLTDWAPVAADLGHRLLGAFEVVMTDVEVVTVWAVDLEGHLAMQRAARDGDERVMSWRDRARAWTTAWREELMRPAPGSPFAPT